MTRADENDNLMARAATEYFQERGFRVDALSYLRPSCTGVDGTIIWISAGEFSGRNLQHGPRIKVVLGYKLTTDGLDSAPSVTITNPQRVLGTLPEKINGLGVRFVESNRDTLLRHWNGELDSAEAIALLKKV